jgi:hypothetical protein
VAIRFIIDVGMVTMKRFIYFACTLVIVCLVVVSCSDEDKIAAAFSGDDELSTGAQVPFLLYQNYPNPCDGSTVIYFELADTMHLTLKVYTEDWQEVTTLIDDDFLPDLSRLRYAHYTVVFNGRLYQCSSGDYYYVMEGLGYKQIRKMRIIQ